jgi:hypothetical protein
VTRPGPGWEAGRRGRRRHEHAGLVVEPSAALGVAAVLEQPERFAGRRVTTIRCGGNVDSADFALWVLEPVARERRVGRKRGGDPWRCWREPDTTTAASSLAAKVCAGDLSRGTTTDLEGVNVKGNRRLRRSRANALAGGLAAAVATAGFAGALPVAAGAADYCVAPNVSCGGTNVATLGQALDLADNATDGDRIFLGADTYTAPTTGGFSYSLASGPVEIIGKGTGQTTLTGPTASSNVLTLFGGTGTAVQDLTIELPNSVAAAARGLSTSGAARRIEVTEYPTQTSYRTGVDLRQGGTLEDSTVTLGDNPYTTAVNLGPGGGTVRRSVLSAPKGVVSGYGGTIERSRVTGANTGVGAWRGVTTIADSVIRFSEGNGAVGIFADDQPGYSTTVNADGVTVVGPALPDTDGVYAGTFLAADQSTHVSLANSIIRGVSTALDAAAPAGATGQASIAASYSDYDPSGNSTFGANASIAQANVSNVGDGGFADAANGDYHLRPGSPLVDAGDPATAQGVDLDGNPLVTDGNGDGIARRDLGAFELATAAGRGPQSRIVTADTRPPLVTGFKADPAIFAVSRTRRAIAAHVHVGTRLRYSLSEAAQVSVTIQRALAGRRAGGKCVRPTRQLRRAKPCTRYHTSGTLASSAKAGANSTRFSGRLGGRALRPGSYRAVIGATDADGNRSTPLATRFRIART